MTDKLKVLLTTEGTYPFHQGGVSTWCDILVNKMPEFEFIVYSIIMNPYVTQKFTLPPSAELIRLPLWGTEEPSESLSIPFSQVYLSKKRTTTDIIESQFIPLFTALIEEFTAAKKNSPHLGKILLDMNLFFENYEYKATFKSKIVWEYFKNQMIQISDNSQSGFKEPTIFALIQSLGWIYRFLNVVNTAIPQADVSHSSAAAFCGIPCVLAKLKNGTPFLLTEHGVYLREQYFSLSQRGYISYMNTFLIRMIQSVVELNYYYADQVSPVCAYNTRWEKEFGVPVKNIKVIYNGVDSSVFTPGAAIEKNINPVIVTVARIDPLKDIKTLIRSAEKVMLEIPEAEFHIFGSIAVPKYYEECVDLIKKLHLEKKFIFKGHITDIPSAYRSGDVIVLSSISEAFPYSIVEAMLVGKAIVATDVGGIREALGETGILVAPSDSEAISKGIIKLIKDNSLREYLALEARERALNYFTLDKVLKHYSVSYSELAVRSNVAATENIVNIRIKLIMDKAYAFKTIGCYQEALYQFKLALKLKPNAESVVKIIMELSNITNVLEDQNQVILLKDQVNALQIVMDRNNTEIG